MHPTLIDFAIGIAIFGTVLSACHRGVGREMLHTVMFAILVTIGYVLFRTQTADAGPEDVVFWLVNSMYYVITAYVLTWVGMKALSPLVIGHETIGLRSRFWAGALSLAKLGVIVFGLNLWFAVHSPDMHPERLQALPPILRESVFVQVSDRLTEKLYRWLAGKNLIGYHKTLERQPTPQELRRMELERTLGVSATSLNTPLE